VGTCSGRTGQQVLSKMCLCTYKFAVLVCFCIRVYHPDDEFVEVEICRRNTKRQMIINYCLCDFLDQVQCNYIRS